MCARANNLNNCFVLKCRNIREYFWTYFMWMFITFSLSLNTCIIYYTYRHAYILIYPYSYSVLYIIQHYTLLHTLIGIAKTSKSFLMTERNYLNLLINFHMSIATACQLWAYFCLCFGKHICVYRLKHPSLIRMHIHVHHVKREYLYQWVNKLLITLGKDICMCIHLWLYRCTEHKHP